MCNAWYTKLSESQNKHIDASCGDYAWTLDMNAIAED